MPVQSSFNLWRKAVPRLKRIFGRLDSIRSTIDDSDVPAQLALIDYELKANREVRETLQSEMRVRREVAELRKLEYDGMTESMIEAELVRIAQRRGYRHVDHIRRHAVEYLMTRGASQDAAQLLVDEVIPPVKCEQKRKPLESYVRATFNEIAEDLDEGIRGVKELLQRPEPSLTSEVTDAQESPATTQNGTESASDGMGDT